MPRVSPANLVWPFGLAHRGHAFESVGGCPLSWHRPTRRLVRERRAWDEGTFVLRDGAQLDVGQIQLNGAEHPAEIGVWDALWLTDAMVVAERGDDGGDLLLGFEAEPSVQLRC